MSKIDALLITPPSRLDIYQGLSNEYAAIEPPVWSTLIANYLIKRNYKVRILDADAENLTHNQTAEKILSIEPVLAIFMIYGQQPSASTQCMPAGKKTCDKLNNLSSDIIKTIVVGTHASALPKKTLEEEPYNFVCQGEGPVTIEKLIEHIKKNKTRLEDIPGLWYRDKNKNIKFNKRAPMFENLDKNLKGQAWELLDMSKYKAHNWHTFGKLETRNNYASLQTSLGCPFKCTFCCINAPFERNTIRFWSPEHIINQIKILVEEINKDLKSRNKMFRLLQGDVGSGKTIVSLIAASNVIESNFQTTFMAPTEILAKQHYNLAKTIFKGTNIKIDFLSGNTQISDKKVIIDKLSRGEINLLIGTHALFQKNVLFKNLGLIIIDEQHKFGVKQRLELAHKGGNDCDILLMSATPIPRTLILTFYGDMNVSRLIEKPINRKKIITLSKPEEKIREVLFFLKKQISLGNQIFWVCPLIEESRKLDYSAAVKKYDLLNSLFPKKVGLIHGNLTKDEKETVLKKFLNKSIDILVSTTVIEVGIDFPNANVIVIENSDKFGLSQLHQLRGRIGRGINQGTCILLFRKNLSKNARKRIRILKSTNDGFEIAEEDMKIRGYGDILGYQQSGIKDFKLADPIHHEALFKLAEINIKEIENNEKDLKRFEPLLKLFDKADIINVNDS